MLLQISDEQFLIKDSESHPHIICDIGETGFWQLYNWHFSKATNINISLLLRKQHHLIKNYISNIFRHLFGQNKFKRTFQIYSFTAKLNANSQEKSEFQDFDIRFINEEQVTNNDIVLFKRNEYSTQTERIRRQSEDPESAFAIIAFDVEDLNYFLKKQSSSITNPRGSYIIILLTPVITDIEQQLLDILKTLWEKYGILNVKIKLPCSDLYEYIYRFKPFVYQNTTWGTLHKFLIQEAINDSINFRNNLRFMEGYPVRVSMFPRLPSAVAKTKLPKAIRENRSYKILKRSGGFGGIDGTVLAYTSFYLNFTTVINNPPWGMEYGYILSNGTLVGSLGDVVYKNVIASFNGRFISKYDSDQIEFTYPLSNDLLCLLVPKSEKIPQWLKISHCFTFEAWFGILGMYVAISIYWSLVRQIDVSSTWIHRDTVDSFLEVFSLFISVPFRKVFNDYERIFFAICMIFNIIFIGTFQGSLYNSYTKVSYFPDINSLEELDKSGLLIRTSSKSLIDAFGNDSKSVMRRLKDKILIFNGSSSLYLVAKQKDSAAFERKNDAKLRITTDYTRKTDGMALLHVVPECPWTYYVSYIVPKGSPYLPLINILINSYSEAGLISKWSSDTVDALILEKRVRPTTDILKPFTLTDMQAAFLLISIGLTLSLIAFIIEVILHYYMKYCKKLRKNRKAKQKGVHLMYQK